MMKEWTVDGPPPVIDVTQETAPARPRKRKGQWPRPPRARWALGALAALAIWLAFAGVFLLISRPLGYAPADMIAPMVLQAVGMFIVYVLIAFIAWHTRRLV
jgi:hypothetical protein